MNPLDNILVGVPEVMRSVVVNMCFDFSTNVLASAVKELTSVHVNMID
jgi:hypothetical protein